MEQIDAEDRWGDALQAVVAAAAHEAATLLPEPERQIGTYHLLLGILSHGNSRAARFLVAQGATYEKLRSAVTFVLTPPAASAGEPPEPTIERSAISENVEVTVTPFADERHDRNVDTSTVPRYTTAAETALANAARKTDGMKDVEHLLIAILGMESVATGILEASAGQSIAKLRKRARRYLV